MKTYKEFTNETTLNVDSYFKSSKKYNMVLIEFFDKNSKKSISNTFPVISVDDLRKRINDFKTEIPFKDYYIKYIEVLEDNDLTPEEWDIMNTIEGELIGGLNESIYHVGKFRKFTFDQLKQGEMHIKIVEDYKKYIGSLIVKKWNITKGDGPKRITNNQIDIHWWNFKENNTIEILCDIVGVDDDLIFELTKSDIDSGNPTPMDLS